MRKIEDLTFFISTSSEQRERGKNSLFGPRQTSSAKIWHVGVYFAKIGCKIKDGFMDILGFQLRDIVFDRKGVWLGLNSTRSAHKFYSQKRKMAESISMAQPSLFFPHFDFTLMNVYMNTGIK